MSNQQELTFTFTFFRPDEWKEGRAYISVRGTVKKIDEYEHIVVLQDGTWIPMEDIVDIAGEMFQALEDFQRKSCIEAACSVFLLYSVDSTWFIRSCSNKMRSFQRRNDGCVYRSEKI